MARIFHRPARGGALRLTPGLMKTTLTDEYLIVHQMGITLAQRAQIALNGARMSWMDESEW
jgi:hypothetical protein